VSGLTGPLSQLLQRMRSSSPSPTHHDRVSQSSPSRPAIEAKTPVVRHLRSAQAENLPPHGNHAGDENSRPT